MKTYKEHQRIRKKKPWQSAYRRCLGTDEVRIWTSAPLKIILDRFFVPQIVHPGRNVHFRGVYSCCHVQIVR